MLANQENNDTTTGSSSGSSDAGDKTDNNETSNGEGDGASNGDTGGSDKTDATSTSGEGGVTNAEHTEPKSTVEATATNEDKPTSKTERLRNARRDSAGDNRVPPEVTTVKPTSTSGEPYNAGGKSDTSVHRGPRFKRHTQRRSSAS